MGVATAIAGIALARRLDGERAVFGWALVIAAFWYIGFGLFHGQALSGLPPQFIAGSVFLALDYLGPYFGDVMATWWVPPACLGFDVVVGAYLFARHQGVAPLAEARAALLEPVPDAETTCA